MSGGEEQRERQRLRERERERGSPADSLMSVEPDGGLDLTALGS